MIWRSRGGSARACSRGAPWASTRWRPSSGRSEPRTSSTSASTSTGVTDGASSGHDPDRRQDRVHEAVEPLDLLERRAVPVRARLAPLDVARLAPGELRLLGQQVGVGAHDGEGRPQLVGDERDELAAGLVDGLERLDPGLRLRLLAALLDDPGQQVGDGAQLGDVRRAEHARPLGLDVEHADRLVVPRQRHAQHRRDEALLVEAADPQEARVGLDVRDHQRLAMRGDPARDPLPERDARPADLEPVEAVGRGQRQVRSVTVEQVQRGDIGMEGVARPVDDRLEQLVPGARGRRQAGDIVDESQLIELVGRGQLVGAVPRRTVRVGVAGRAGSARRGGRAIAAHGRSIGCHGRHDTRVGKVAAAKGCGRVLARLRKRPARAAPMKGASRPAPDPGRANRSRAHVARSRPASARPAPATPWRSRSGCSARSSARSSRSRPARACSSSSSGSGARRSPCAAATIRRCAAASRPSSTGWTWAPSRRSSRRSPCTSSS